MSADASRSISCQARAVGTARSPETFRPHRTGPTLPISGARRSGLPSAIAVSLALVLNILASLISSLFRNPILRNPDHSYSTTDTARSLRAFAARDARALGHAAPLGATLLIGAACAPDLARGARTCPAVGHIVRPAPGAGRPGG